MMAEGTITQSILAAAAMIAVAVLLHWSLLRLGRRLRVWIAHRGRGTTTARQAQATRMIEAGLLLPKTAVWIFVLWFVSTRFALLRLVRDCVEMTIAVTLMSPLIEINERTYTTGDVLALPAALATLWVAVAGFSHLLKTRILRATLADHGAQDIVALLVRYALLLIGSIVVLQVWGIDLRSLTILASVLGVGIGFGLQNIANNFVSGIILNFERPVQPGDFVNIGEWAGTVERVGGRSTEIRTLDNVTILIPNSRLLESDVVNWTRKDPLSRVHVPVGVAYGSDLRRARLVLLDSARSHPGVLSEPTPRVELRRFGDSAIELELLVWTRDPRAQARLKSELNYQIARNFNRFKVEIPFPQQDLHLRSPQIERVVEALGRRYLGVEDLAPEKEEDLPPLPMDLDDEAGPHRWDEEEIAELAERMRGADGVEIASRRHLLTTYPRCFIGREAVDWVVRAAGVSRDDAVAFGGLLVERGLVHHVLDEHSFKDGNFYYRFYADEPRMRVASAAAAERGVASS